MKKLCDISNHMLNTLIKCPACGCWYGNIDTFVHVVPTNCPEGTFICERCFKEMPIDKEVRCAFYTPVMLSIMSDIDKSANWVVSPYASATRYFLKKYYNVRHLGEICHLIAFYEFLEGGNAVCGNHCL